MTVSESMFHVEHTTAPPAVEPLSLFDDGAPGVRKPVAHEDDAHGHRRRLSIQERFAAFHALNPWVYDSLVSLARDLRGRGYEKAGIGMLWEVLRWSYLRATADPFSTFKLNDHYRSRYARLLMEQEPDLAGMFDVRELTAA